MSDDEKRCWDCDRIIDPTIESYCIDGYGNPICNDCISDIDEITEEAD